MSWITSGLARLGIELKLAPMRQKGGPAYVTTGQDGRAVSSNWSGDKAVNEGLKASAWVYSASRQIATGLASVPLLLEQFKADQWALDAAHPLQTLLSRPNPFMAAQDVKERWAYHMLLAGNALWFLNIVQGKPVEIWPLKPDEIKPIQSRSSFIAGYEWKPAGQDKQTLGAAQVAHWMFVDPSNIYWGLSPVMAAARAVDTDIAASNWNRSVLANDGKPPYVVLLDQALSAQQQRDATTLMREQLDGNSVRKMLALGSVRDVKPIAMNAVDMDWLDGRRFSREEIGAVMGVPPVLMSFGEAATFSNLDAAKAMLWEDRIVPMLDDLCQGLMMALFPYFGLAEGQWRIRADLSGVRALQANLKTESEVGQIKANTYKTYVDAGVPPNIAARYLDLELPEIAGGDVPRTAAPQLSIQQSKGRAPPGYQRKDKGEAARLTRMDGWAAEVQTKVAALLESQGNSLASAYAAGTLDAATDLSLDDWQSLLSAVHTAVLESEGAIGYAAALKAVSSTNLGGAFDVLDPAVVDFIKTRAGDMAKGITDTTRLALRAELAAGVEAGEGSRDIAKRIRTLHSDWTGARAELIARTETGNAFQASHQLSAQQASADAGVEMVKTWRSAHDDRVRPDHKAMDGETVGLDETFSNGEEPGQEPNCRCVATFGPKG